MQPLDYEAQSKYNLILTVENLTPLSNKAPNLPVSTATVVVTVANENEAPHFREDPIQIVVPESVAPGTLLKTNIAFDPDHSDLRYEAEANKDECVPVFKNASELQQFYGSFSNAVFVVGMRLAEILKGGWTSAEIQETLLPKEPLTCDLHMLKAISIMLLSRLQVSSLNFSFTVLIAFTQSVSI